METVRLPKCDRSDLKMEKLSKQATKRAFLNNVDSYTSRHVAELLSGHVAVGEEEEEEEDDGGEKLSRHSKAFQVVGTVCDQAAAETPFVVERYLQPDRDELLSKLMVCDVVIYNVTQHREQVEEALWAASALHNLMGQFPSPKVFVLVSTVMSWACSKPLDPDDAELPFTDEIYWIRRAHPNFHRHAELEKRVVKLGHTNPTLFCTYVVTSGLQYGMGEQIFHYFFKTAWIGEEQELPLFGDGRNTVPTIHVTDLARVIQKVIEHQPKPQYLLAVDSSNNTMEDIIQAVASALGPRTVRLRPPEEAFLTADLSVMDIDSLLVNLLMDAVHIRTVFSMDWLCEFGLVENIGLVVEQYRQVRQLQPVRLCVLGPPAVGKSTLCKQICEHYNLKHISLREMKVGNNSQEEGMDTDSETEEEEVNTVEDTMNDQLRALKDQLLSTPCRNQGFVLEDFPLTYEQAKEFFSDEEREEASDITASMKILPELVVCLEASDSFLTDRVMNLPEEQVQVLHYEPKAFLTRLSQYRASSMSEGPVLNFFSEVDIPVLSQDVSTYSETDWLVLTQKICDSIGPPRNYRRHLPKAGEQEEQRRKAEEKRRREAHQQAEEERWEAEEAAARAAHWEDWSTALAETRQQEEQLLEARSVPMRRYLMEQVMPTLTAGLAECCRLKPSDPVDFLAEYLLQNNPYDSQFHA